MEITVEKATEKMVGFYHETSDRPIHDINHFLKVWGFAHTIGRLEGLDDEQQLTLELTAVAHDIACPLCREKYGDATGDKQELEGEALTREFYRDFSLPDAMLDRICFIVSHHHTYSNVDGLDYQIMLEADFLVNAEESSLSGEAIASFRKRVFRTEAGRHLLDEMYPVS